MLKQTFSSSTLELMVEITLPLKFHLVWEPLGILLETTSFRYSLRFGDLEKKTEKAATLEKKGQVQEQKKQLVE